jgi:hypothetical protein
MEDEQWMTRSEGVKNEELKKGRESVCERFGEKRSERRKRHLHFREEE